MKRWDALDSLIYLHRALPLDWLIDNFGERFGYEDENEDTKEFLDVLESCQSLIREEVRWHHDGRTRYSTGVSFERVYQYPSTEPGESDEDVPVIQEVHMQLRPDGFPFEAPMGGVWVDEINRGPEAAA